jgi:hypothetical protein
MLGGRERIDACETLLLRARADLDQGLPREAALQLRVGLDALLAELPSRDGADAGPGPDQAADLTALGGRREIVHEAAEEALGGALSAERAEQVAETLRICERVLRRRRILSE